VGVVGARGDHGEFGEADGASDGAEIDLQDIESAS
jgi:hypothetical protein